MPDLGTPRKQVRDADSEETSCRVYCTSGAADGVMIRVC